MSRDPLPALPAFAAGVALSAFVFLFVFLHASPPPGNSSPSPGSSGLMRFTPFSVEPGGQNYPVWSPDGKFVAFVGRPERLDSSQIFVRRFDPPSAAQLTALQEPIVAPVAWTSTGRIVFYASLRPKGLWSISPLGGVPELLQAEQPGDSALSIARDASAVALLHRSDDGDGVWISTPPGSLPKRYEPDPFASRTPINRSATGFSPNGRQILMVGDRGAGEEFWLLPYPATASKPPHRILQNLPVGGAEPPQFSWMPDSRRIVVSTSTDDTAQDQLFLADTETGKFSLISGGARNQRSPSVSPDGDKLLFAETRNDFDVVSVDLSSGAVAPLLSTERAEEMPAWSAKQPVLVYSSDRGGGYEIWIHKQGLLDQPIVTTRDFPSDTTRWLIGPSLARRYPRHLPAHRARKSGETRLVDFPCLRRRARPAPGRESPGHHRARLLVPGRQLLRLHGARGRTAHPQQSQDHRARRA